MLPMPTSSSSSDSSDSSYDTSDLCLESDTIDGIGSATYASTTNTTGNNSNSFYPSLFLFDETCASTVTGPIFYIDPCIVGAAAGDAVDNRIMRTKLLALGVDALENQDIVEEDVSAGRVAKNLTNQLQVATQNIAAAQFNFKRSHPSREMFSLLRSDLILT